LMVRSDADSDVYREDDFCGSSGGACDGRNSSPSEIGTSSSESCYDNFERSTVTSGNKLEGLVCHQRHAGSQKSSCSHVTSYSRETLRGSHKSLDIGAHERPRDGSRTGSKKSLDSGVRRLKDGGSQSNKSVDSSREKLTRASDVARADESTCGRMRKKTMNAAADPGMESRGQNGVSHSSSELGSYVDVGLSTMSAPAGWGCLELGLTTEPRQATLQGGCGRGGSTSVPCGARDSRPLSSVEAGRFQGEVRRLPNRPLAIPVAPERREQELGDHISALFESLQINLDAKLGRLEGRLDRVEDQQKKFMGVCCFNGGNRGSRPGSCKRAPSHCAAWRPAGKAQHSRPERRSGGGGAWPVCRNSSRRPASAPRRRRGPSWRPASVRRCRALHQSWPQ